MVCQLIISVYLAPSLLLPNRHIPGKRELKEREKRLLTHSGKLQNIANLNCDVARLRQFNSWSEDICPRFDRITPVKLYVYLFFDVSQVNKEIVRLVI